MKPEHKELVSELFCQIFEQTAFMFGDPADEPEEQLAAPEAELVKAQMDFDGPISGHVELAAPLALCTALSANIQGLDEDDPEAEAQALDAIKEMLNIFCGQALTALAGEEAVFHLSIPELQTINAAAWDALRAGEETLGFLIDDHPVLLQASWNGSLE